MLLITWVTLVAIFDCHVTGMSVHQDDITDDIQDDVTEIRTLVDANADADAREEIIQNGNHVVKRDVHSLVEDLLNTHVACGQMSQCLSGKLEDASYYYCEERYAHMSFKISLPILYSSATIHQVFDGEIYLHLHSCSGFSFAPCRGPLCSFSTDMFRIVSSFLPRLIHDSCIYRYLPCDERTRHHHHMVSDNVDFENAVKAQMATYSFNATTDGEHGRQKRSI